MTWLRSIFGGGQVREPVVTLQTSKPFLAENYLQVWLASDDIGKGQHSEALWNAANRVAAEVEAESFVLLLEQGNVESVEKALIASQGEFERLRVAEVSERYWAASYALICLIIQNRLGMLGSTPAVQQIAENGAHLYAHEVAYRTFKK